MANRMKSTNELDFMPRGEVFPSPNDWRDLFIYFLLVDRFDNNEENLPPYDPDSAPKGRDPEQVKVFQRGNLKGVMRRLDYIQGLGAKAIWLSPVFKNRREKNDTYHGYGIQDFLEVDSLAYLSLDGMLNCAKQPSDHYCSACFSEGYPMPVGRGVEKLGLERFPLQQTNHRSARSEPRP